MEVVMQIVQRAIDFILSLQLTDILDILIIAYLVYRMLIMVHRTNSSRLFKGVLLVLLGLWVSSYGLKGLNYILERIVEWGVLALLILFQPEIRRALEQMGSSRLPFLEMFNKPPVDRQVIEQTIAQTVSA